MYVHTQKKTNNGKKKARKQIKRHQQNKQYMNQNIKKTKTDKGGKKRESRKTHCCSKNVNKKNVRVSDHISLKKTKKKKKKEK